MDDARNLRYLRNSRTARRGRGMSPIVAIGVLGAVMMALYVAGGVRPLSAAPRPVPLEPGTLAIVSADGDCLRMRDTPGFSGTVVNCIPDGTVVSVLQGAQESDGFRWQLIQDAGLSGWAADEFLEPFGTTLPPAVTPTPPPSAATLPVPPAGGLTLGLAGTSDPLALAEAQSFAVESISALDLATQRFLVFIPGAPQHAISLTAAQLTPGRPVTIKRSGQTGGPGPLPTAAVLPPAGTASVLLVPPAGGLTQGVAGTNDPQRVAAAQPFPVESVSMLHVQSQRWLVFIPGAPAVVNTLHTGLLDPGDIVTVKRSAGGTPPPPPPPGGDGSLAPPDELPAGVVPGPAGNE